ncbi:MULTISPECIES: helix-turn-helix transcriptional regulator [unclassified Rhizobium]|uniref:helix-turn-helix transcriptional regulator n=1 Tax=unclassified Rhizobium TaxID=2613769 RepID=UPI00071434FD|nr:MULTISPECIES: helix-turn-helix transcriptional regulator [unclassified Rhizobium]KQS84755.1 hypothetical protein ASG50_29605 [Rhizobium sp. Leaf386]KQT05282.1 hypothetical protein ASG42_20335 [Rhizobium sp. Leaf391]KQT91724.1 hypothetical protein ASG68_17985 [Rhizobium sp. Leaf453]
MRLNLEKLDQALDRSVEAALDPALWPDVLDRVVSATGSFGANIISTISRSPDTVISTDSLKPAFAQYFADGWHINDYRLNGVPLLQRKGTAREQEYAPRDEFERHDFYRYQAKYGIGKSCLIGLSAPGELVALALHRKLDSDFYSDEEADILQRVGQRVGASVAIARAMSNSKVSGMVEAFTMAGAAAVFFDRFCRVAAVTAAAEKCFGKELDVADGQFQSHIPGIRAAIQNRMQAVIDKRWLGMKAFSGPLVVRRLNAGPLSVHVQRLGGHLPDLFAHSVGVCLIDGGEQKPKQAPQHIRKLLGLTASEAAIAALISQGMTLREIADRKGIAYETVRAHLRSIFGKTGTKRQAELVTLLNHLNVMQ